MAKWSRTQIAMLALAAGWGTRSDDVSWVAMAESGGDDHAVNSIGCVGLLQINQPVHVKSHPTWTRAWLQNPRNNLAAGLVLYKEAGRFDGPWADSKTKGGIPGGWGPHVTASSGAIQADDSFGSMDPLEEFWNKLLGEPKRGPGSPDWNDDPFGLNDKVGITGLKESADQIGRIAQAIAKAGNWLGEPGNWVRILYVGGGVVLALVAVNTIVKPPIGRSVKQVTGQLPVARVQKAVAARRAKRTPEPEPEPQEEEA